MEILSESKWVKPLTYCLLLRPGRCVPQVCSCLQRGCRKSKITCVHYPSSLCRCDQQQLQLLLRGLPRRRLLRRRRWWGEIRRRTRLRRQQLCVKGQVQLIGRCQESTGCWLISRSVASFPGEEDRVEPLSRLWWWEAGDENKHCIVGIRDVCCRTLKKRKLSCKCGLLTFLLLLCFLF